MSFQNTIHVQRHIIPYNFCLPNIYFFLPYVRECVCKSCVSKLYSIRIFKFKFTDLEKTVILTFYS